MHTKLSVPSEAGLARPGRGWLVAATAAIVAVVAVSALGAAAVAGRHSSARPNQASTRIEDMRFVPSHLTLRSGDGTVRVSNGDAIAHTLSVPALGLNLSVASGETAAARVTASPGTYRMVCTIPAIWLEECREASASRDGG
jgi:plastocyanin